MDILEAAVRAGLKGRGVEVGRYCVIMESVELGSNVRIGNHVIIYPGTCIGDNVWIEDNVVLGRKPRSGATSLRPSETGSCRPLMIASGVVIGTGVVVYEHCILEEDVMIADLAAIREKVCIGRGSRIGRLTTIECNSSIGRGSVVQTACHITGDAVIGDNVFLGPEVCTTNDKKMLRYSGGILKGPIIKNGASVGANCTLLSGIEIGEEAVIGAGAVVTKNVPAREVWFGVPACFVKKVEQK